MAGPSSSLGFELRTSSISNQGSRDIKIDRVFVERLSCDDPATCQSSQLALVEAITQLGHTLGVSVVAEGAESANHYECLRIAGRDLVQSIHIAGPMPSEEVEAVTRAIAAAFGHSRSNA